MGKNQRTREVRKKLREFKISLDELEALLDRLEKECLLKSDYPLIIELIKNFTLIQEQFKNNTQTVKKLQKWIFGSKTEKIPLPVDLKATDTGESAPGHGKKSVDQWVDSPVAICLHPHEKLKEGQLCPKCQQGKVYSFKPSVRIRVVANRALDVERHEVERLRCSACGWLYTATPREGLRQHPEATPEAMAMSALLRYQSGFPAYRLVSFLSAQGVFLTWTKIWTLILGVFEVASGVFESLWRLAANAQLAQNDDTKMRVIDLMKVNASKTQGERKAIQTTGLVMHLKEGHKVMLYRTGHKNAGENLQAILSQRTDPDPPMQMADALSANDPDTQKTKRGGCMDHYRRGYYDLYEDWTAECEFVLTHLRAVYKVDAVAKKKQLTPSQRLALHQKESTPHMEAVYHWMQTQHSERKVEPNSNLGKVIQYGINHWPRLTAFLHLEGMPISNIEVERLLKKAVIHRKNSLFYKTIQGAYVGDVLMSLIQTATEAKVNAFHYLTSLIENKKDVKDQPEQWLPWNYLHRLADLKPAHL